MFDSPELRMAHLEERLATTEQFVRNMGELLPALQVVVDQQSAALVEMVANFGTFSAEQQQQSQVMQDKIAAVAETIDNVDAVLKQLLGGSQAGEEWKGDSEAD